MNPPSDPIQLLVYGIGTFLVVLGLKLWDRRRDGKLQRTADSAAAHAADAAGHAAAAVDAVRGAERRSASSEQAGEILQVGHDTNATLVQVLLRLSVIQDQMRRLEPLPERVAQLEGEMDVLVLPTPVRRRQSRP